MVEPPDTPRVKAASPPTSALSASLSSPASGLSPLPSVSHPGVPSPVSPPGKALRLHRSGAILCGVHQMGGKSRFGPAGPGSREASGASRTATASLRPRRRSALFSLTALRLSSPSLLKKRNFMTSLSYRNGLPRSRAPAPSSETRANKMGLRHQDYRSHKGARPER